MILPWRSHATPAATAQDDQLEPLLAAAADATEQAVLDALLSAEAVTGFRGHHRTDSDSGQINRMKIFISADIEGIAGVMRPEHCTQATRNIRWPGG